MFKTIFKPKIIIFFTITFFLVCLLVSVILLSGSLFKKQFSQMIFIAVSIIFFGSIFLISELRFRKIKKENEKLNSDLNKAIFDIMALFEFTNVLGSDLGLTQMMELMVDTIKRIHCYDGCCLFFYEDNQQFSAKVNRGFPEKLNKTEFPFKDLVGEALIKSRQAILINNIDEEFPDFIAKHPNFKDSLGEFSSFALLPLVADKKFIGLLLLAKYTASAYVQEDLRLFLIISNQAGLAIQNRRLYEQAYYSAITDGLTGIYNQKYFREQLEFQLEKAKEYGFKISLILIDIDHFKKFNDTYGHQIGDKVLKEVSKVIQDCVNPDSLVARYGGEEFVVILPDAPIDTAVIVGEKIRKTIEAHVVKTNEYPELNVTVSLGVATFPDHIKNMRRMVVELIDIADDNLYSAKNAGRNRVCAINYNSKPKPKKITLNT